MDADRERKAERIKKLLTLANNRGATEHEAATALRMAQEMMEAEGITEDDIAALEAAEQFTVAGAVVRVPLWESTLAAAIAAIFGCDSIHHRNLGTWSFVGIQPLPDLAGYAFDVLHRQCLVARRNYLAEGLRRVKVRKNKIRRADLFCDGWIQTAVSKATAMRRPAAHSRAIAAYKNRQYGEMTDLTPLDRNSGRLLGDRDYQDLLKGRQAGDAAELRTGVGGMNAPDLRRIGQG